MTEEVKTEVVDTKPEGAGTEQPPVETPKEETSPEVKTEPAKVENVDNAKMQEQINNLNIALKQERESKKTDSAAVKNMEDELAKSKDTITKLSEVFNPTQPEEETAPVGLTMEQLETFYEEKEQVKLRKDKEDQQASMIRTEIADMEKSWDGAEGKPKYDDDAVIAWQKSENKLHLTPKAAFYEMKHNDIVDYEVKQRLTKKPNVENVEQPGGTPEGREPAETKPQSDLETRAAVLEAMDATTAENNN